MGMKRKTEERLIWLGKHSVGTVSYTHLWHFFIERIWSERAEKRCERHIG